MRKSAVVFVLFSLAMTLSAPAFGQKKKAKVLFDKGVAALEQKKFQNALSAFEEAYELSPHWAVLAHIGTCHANLNHPIKAITSLEQYLVDGGSNIPEDEQQTAREIIRHQRRKVGVLVLSVEEEGIEALVDGGPIGRSPFKEQLVLPGTHEVAVIFDEDDIVKRDFEISAGQEYMLRVEREKHVATAPPPPAVVTETPDPPPEEQEVDTFEPVFEPTPIEEESPREGSLTPFFVALGFTVASAAATGVGWGFYTHYTLSEKYFADYLDNLTTMDPRFVGFTWEDTCADRTTTEEEVAHFCNTEASRRDFDDKAGIWFIVGIAGAGATVVSASLAVVFYTLRHKFGKKSEFASFHIAPYVAERQRGLTLSVTF